MAAEIDERSAGSTLAERARTSLVRKWKLDTRRCGRTLGVLAMARLSDCLKKGGGRRAFPYPNFAGPAPAGAPRSAAAAREFAKFGAIERTGRLVKRSRVYRSLTPPLELGGFGSSAHIWGTKRPRTEPLSLPVNTVWTAPY